MTVGWELCLDGALVVQVTGGPGGWSVAGTDDVGRSFTSVEEAVGATPLSRSLRGRGQWRVATTLPTWEALDLLDEPGQDVEEVTINDEVFDVLADGGDRLFFRPKHSPSDDTDEDEDEDEEEEGEEEGETVLTLGLKAPGFGSPGGSPAYANWVTRAGGVYRLSSSEDMDFDDVDPSPHGSDIEACVHLLAEVDGPVTSFNWEGEGPLGDAEVADLIAKVTCPYGVVWFDNVLWQAGPPPTRMTPSPVARFAGEPTQATRQLDGQGWVGGTVGPPRDQGSKRGRPWWAVLLTKEADMELLIAMDFCLGGDEDSGERDGVIVDLPGNLMLGFQIRSAELACRYAGLLAGVPIAGDRSALYELADDGSVLRSWTWDPRPVPVPEAMERLDAACAVIEEAS